MKSMRVKVFSLGYMYIFHRFELAMVYFTGAIDL